MHEAPDTSSGEQVPKLPLRGCGTEQLSGAHICGVSWPRRQLVKAGWAMRPLVHPKVQVLPEASGVLQVPGTELSGMGTLQL